MKKYKSVKIVEAFKITDIVTGSVPSKLILGSDNPEDNVEVTKAYSEKHDPQVGGYYVRYEDGYESFSTAEAFENGYVDLDEYEAAVDASVVRFDELETELEETVKSADAVIKEREEEIQKLRAENLELNKKIAALGKTRDESDLEEAEDIPDPVAVGDIPINSRFKWVGKFGKVLDHDDNRTLVSHDEVQRWIDADTVVRALL